MSTDKNTAEKIASELELAGTIRIKNMTGDYLVYLDEVLIGQINENALFIKTSPYGDSLFDENKKASPYEGAKPAYKINHEDMKDVQSLAKLLKETKDFYKKK